MSFDMVRQGAAYSCRNREKSYVKFFLMERLFVNAFGVTMGAGGDLP